MGRTDDSTPALPLAPGGAAHARLREALSHKPGWRSLAPQFWPSAQEWRASAYDARHGASGRLTGTGDTEELAVSRLAAMLGLPAD